MRVGLGYDSHRFAAGRKLILGGVEIAHPLGLAGHSDADAVAHALTDAVLGAAGLGDIGTHVTQMRQRLAGALSVAPVAISVKGKTNEGMGWIGRAEGIAVIAVAVLE